MERNKKTFSREETSHQIKRKKPTDQNHDFVMFLFQEGNQVVL